jgi:hypothetical protein
MSHFHRSVITCLVGLVGIALDSLNATVLALDLVLVGAPPGEAVPLLAVVVTSRTLLGPCSLYLSVWDVNMLDNKTYLLRMHHEIHNLSRGVLVMGEPRGRSQR